MKVAFLSDVHGNLPALRAVYADAQRHGVEAFFCLGDVVGYGPNPRECIEFIQRHGWFCLRGNHDYYVSSPVDLQDVREEAISVIEWTRGQLDAHHLEWLRQLPLQSRVGRNLIVHASPEHPEQWQYVRNELDAFRIFENHPFSFAFIGHTHVPRAFKFEGHGARSLGGAEVRYDPAGRYLVNVGSVGQSRDGDRRASYVVLDRSRSSIEFRRVEYDVHQVIEAISTARLPEVLSERLRMAA
jgi:diadenosine tetraphosphatase ApaH/serine/threonine PP2A family protein phosphatase